jgi:glycosyltransferase involved in cell wall biosynthesis
VIQASSTFYNMDRRAALEITKVKGAPVFLWVGMLIPRKDPLTAVRAFLEFVRHSPDAKLYMIYQSDELLQEIHGLLETSKENKDAIVLVGSISHDQLLYWYNSAGFFISASHYEGSGISLSEAMSCGCIPVTSDFISFQKMTGPGKCGLLYEPGSVTALLKILIQTTELDMEDERAKTLQQFKAELSFEAIAKKIEQVMASLQR